MEKKKQIGEHIVDHLSERMNEEIVDPVLDEWLAEDESKILNGIKRSGKKQALIWSKKLLMLNTHGIRSIVSIRRDIISGNAW
jgi:hypothetical protein